MHLTDWREQRINEVEHKSLEVTQNETQRSWKIKWNRACKII